MLDVLISRTFQTETRIGQLSLTLQQLLNANPVLVIVGVFVVGIIFVLAARILLASASCLVRVGCAIVVIIAIGVLLRLLLVR